ncbi:MAG: cbb3-type cytochrome oxidase assembly protein CcoS [Candidatus Eremiobacteraeota bacterium]|nr:cbb3-type cytochrome oxidase assembly protein CcoS [Candidatus Eremiobacteraeota bacterium]
MEVLYVLVPAALFLSALGISMFVLAVKNGQYEDLDADGVRFLQDD